MHAWSLSLNERGPVYRWCRCQSCVSGRSFTIAPPFVVQKTQYSIKIGNKLLPSPVNEISERIYGILLYFSPRSAINSLVGICSFTGGPLMLLVIGDLLYILVGQSAHGTYCYWPPVIGLIICPIMWLGTPKDSWYVMSQVFIKIGIWLHLE